MPGRTSMTGRATHSVRSSELTRLSIYAAVLA